MVLQHYEKREKKCTENHQQSNCVKAMYQPFTVLTCQQNQSLVFHNNLFILEVVWIESNCKTSYLHRLELFSFGELRPVLLLFANAEVLSLSYHYAKNTWEFQFHYLRDFSIIVFSAIFSVFIDPFIDDPSELAKQ